MTTRSGRWVNAEIEKHYICRNSLKIYRLIRSGNLWKPSISEMIREPGDSLVRSQKHRMDILSDHSMDEFNWPTATVGLLPLPANKIMQEDINSPPQMEVMRKIDCLKTHVAARTDGMSPFLFKQGGKVLPSGLKLSWNQCGQENRFLSTGIDQ